MTKIFSVEERKKILEGSTGYAFCLRCSFEKSRAVGGLASSAGHDIVTAAYCFLVGLDAPGMELAKRAVDWLTYGISTNEKPQNGYFPDGTEAAYLYNLALAKWLLGESDTASVAQSIERRERYYLGKAGRDPVEVALTMVQYLDGGFTELIEAHIKRLWTNKRLPAEVAAAQALCEDRETCDGIHPVVAGLLRKKGNEWLARGHASSFAKWVKVADSRMTARVPAPELLREALRIVQAPKPPGRKKP
jgi:hypothetical protein